MAVRKNSFTEKSPESKARTINSLRRHGNPNWPGRGGNPDGKNISASAIERRKIASEWLREFYHSNPKRLKKLMMAAIEYAEAGHARFAEMILDRLEGPVKHEPAAGDTYNFNFMSAADRERATSIVDDILAMDPKTIAVPQLEESACQIMETSSTSETPDSKQPMTD